MTDIHSGKIRFHFTVPKMYAFNLISFSSSNIPRRWLPYPTTSFQLDVDLRIRWYMSRITFKLLVLKLAPFETPTTKYRNSFGMKNVLNLRISSVILFFLAVLSLTQSVDSTRKYPILLICYPLFLVREPNFSLISGCSWILWKLAFWRRNQSACE